MLINQGTNDGNCLELRSTGDVTHGATDICNTGSYAFFKKAVAASGGLYIAGLTEGASQGVYMEAYCVSAIDTTKSNAGVGAFQLLAAQTSTTTIGNVVADANAFVFQVYAGGAVKTRHILDGDGDSHQDVGTAWTNFHGYNDLELLGTLSAHVSRKDDPIRGKFAEFLENKRDVLEKAKLVTFNDDGHHFVNMSKLSMLHTGALLQAGERIKRLEQRCEELAKPKSFWKRLVGN